MAQGRNDGKRGFSGLRDEAQETVQLIVAYIKQETLEPVKGLGRYILFGVAGSVALSIGLAILAVGLLRVLQTETGSAFTGNLSWIPYLLCTVVVVLVAYLAVRAISRGQTPKGRPDAATSGRPAPTVAPTGPVTPGTGGTSTSTSTAATAPAATVPTPVATPTPETTTTPTDTTTQEEQA